MNTPIRIKTFRAKTLQDAFEQIRKEFGPDASILETKAARKGFLGRSRLEVTASSNASDFGYWEVEPSAFHSKNPHEDGQPSSGIEYSSSSIVNSDDENGTGNSSVSKENEDARPEHVLGQVLQELVDAGIDPGIANQWIEATRLSGDPLVMRDVWTVRSEILSWIRDWVHAAPPMELDHSHQQVIALVGPTGAGKTTSLAKIAANLSMERGLSVGVLSTDSMRKGSNQLLRSYSEVLGWHFEVADSIEQVPSYMESFAGCRFVLIDTCGCSPADTESLEKLNQLISLTKPTQTHLVISSTCNTRSFLRYEEGFGQLNPNRMILTRLDEAGGLGSFFSCLQSSSLPVSYLTNGRNIPADLIQATELRLAQHIMAQAD